MTIDEAREEIGDFDSFTLECCICCTTNAWYCPSYCEFLEKASKMPFEKIQKAYARHDGDLIKVFRYIKNFRL